MTTGLVVESQPAQSQPGRRPEEKKSGDNPIPELTSGVRAVVALYLKCSKPTPFPKFSDLSTTRQRGYCTGTRWDVQGAITRLLSGARNPQLRNAGDLSTDGSRWVRWRLALNESA
jgi:hypothetical protein